MMSDVDVFRPGVLNVVAAKSYGTLVVTVQRDAIEGYVPLLLSQYRGMRLSTTPLENPCARRILTKSSYHARVGGLDFFFELAIRMKFLSPFDKCYVFASGMAMNILIVFTSEQPGRRILQNLRPSS
ncbi:hypothetical protein Tco_0947393 [Tanacetum coccineum]